MGWVSTQHPSGWQGRGGAEERWEAVVRVAIVFVVEVPVLGPVLVHCTALGLVLLSGTTLGHLLHLQPEITKLHRLLQVEGETVRTLMVDWV